MRLLKLKTVLAATDLDPSSDAALKTAEALADAAGASLHIVHVASDQGGTTKEGGSSDLKAQLAATVRRAGVSARDDRIHVRSGAVEEGVSSLSIQLTADVVVIGHHRRRADTGADNPIGNTAYAIVTHSLAPCLVTSRALDPPIRRVVVAIDTSETARGALLVALSWSSALRDPKDEAAGPTLTALHVESGQSMSPKDTHIKRTVDHELDILRRSAGSWAGVKVEGATETNLDPAKAITKFVSVHEAELVVLGTRGLSTDDASRLGSVSAAVTRQLELPVLLVPPAVWRTYVKDMDYF